MGFNPSKIDDSYYTVNAVEHELSRGSVQQLRFQTSKENGNLHVQNPSPHAKKIVEDSATHLGESGKLSEADAEVLALALDLKQELKEPVTIVSDDYAIQNLAEHLQVKYRSLANYGILHKYQWIMYCPACHRKYQPPLKNCTFCGTSLRRRVLSKKRTRSTQT